LLRSEAQAVHAFAFVFFVNRYIAMPFIRSGLFRRGTFSYLVVALTVVSGAMNLPQTGLANIHQVSWTKLTGQYLIRKADESPARLFNCVSHSSDVIDSSEVEVGYAAVNILSGVWSLAVSLITSQSLASTFLNSEAARLT
jgi:hypothetical protein